MQACGCGWLFPRTKVLFPAFRSLLRPGKHRAKDGTVVLVTSLEKLYRVFERC